MEDTSDFQFSISDNSNDSFNEKKNEFIPKYRKKSNSPNYLNNREPKKIRNKNKEIKKERTPSPIYKCSSQLLYNGNEKYEIIQKKLNIIPGSEEESKKLKDCEKRKLPKEKVYIIKKSNYEKIMSLIKGTNEKEKLLVESTQKYEKEIKIREEKILKLNKLNKSIIGRNNELITSLNKKKKEYDELNIEMNKYEKTYNKLIYLIKYILQLFPKNNNIQNKIIELQLEFLLNNFDETKIKISDLMTDEQNERNNKLLETLNQLRDIEDMKKLIDNFKIQSSSDNLMKTITQQMKRINELTDKYEKLDNNYINIKAKYNNLIVENNEQINNYKERIKIFEIQISNLTQDNIKLKYEIDKLKDKIKNLEYKNNNQLIDLDNNNSDKNIKKIEELTLINQDQENIINGYKIQIKYLESDKEKKNEIINKMEKELECQKKKISEYESINNNNNLISNNNIQNEFTSINHNQKFTNLIQENLDFDNPNNYFQDAKADLEIKLLQKKLKEYEKIKMDFPNNNEEARINTVTYIGDLFLDFYNQSKLIEEIIEKNNNFE